MTASARGTVLLVGASGNLGRATIPVLIDAGWRVRAMSRTPDRLADVVGQQVSTVRGDLRDPASLAAACDGADAIVAGAHAALGNHGSNRPATVDRDGNRALVDAARDANVVRFVFVSGAGATLDHAIDFFRIKAEAEGFVRDSGLPHVILKPGAFMETWMQFMGASVLDQGKATLLGDATKPVNYVSVRDVARFIEIALRDDALLGTTLRLGGPENLSAEQVVDIFEHAAGRPVRRTYVPAFVVGTMKTLLRPVLPGVARILSMATLPPSADDRFDPTELLQRYPGSLTRFEELAQERASSMRGR